MLDELVKQVRRLFSSKSNGSRLVFNPTDRLHYYKQILLAISIVLLLGYSQFRAHFECQGVDKGLNSETLTNFCWINGTTTLHSKDPGPASARQRPSAGRLAGGPRVATNPSVSVQTQRHLLRACYNSTS